MKTESTVLDRYREATRHKERERGDAELELSSTFSLVVLIRSSLRGVPLPLRVRAQITLFTTWCPEAN